MELHHPTTTKIVNVVSLCPLRHKDGSWRWLESTVSNLLVVSWVKAIVFNYRDITERKQAEEQTQRQLQRLATLRAIDQAIAGSMDVNLVFKVILDHVISQLAVDAAVILLYNPAAQALEYTTGRGFRTKALQYTRLPLGEGYAGQAALARQMVHIPDLQGRKTDFLRSPTFSQEGFVSYFGVPLIAKGEIRGVLEVFHRAAFEAKTEWLNFLETLAGQTAIAIDNATLFKGLQLSNIELTMAYDATIEGWSRALDLRDKETEGHTQRVTEMSQRLALAMGINEAELVNMRRGALLHDIGKMGVPDSILLKPGQLTDEEWGIMRQHPQFAYDMLFPIAYLRPALDIPFCHHEKWDGTGYPRGLKREEIPLAARIFAVVDVYDALCSDRPYRAAWTKEKVREHIKSLGGTHFDPKIIELFLKLDMETKENNHYGQ
jgi:HD-GYP domain-containing protein (c-di-GMP phosphodiesterase class II)